MNKYEIAMEITKCAIEQKVILFSKNVNDLSGTNDFNCKEICDFYSEVLETIDSKL
jgi:hypothetical protein